MTNDRLAGTAKNATGKVQEAYGSVAGGYASQVKGKVRDVSAP